MAIYFGKPFTVPQKLSIYLASVKQPQMSGGLKTQTAACDAVPGGCGNFGTVVIHQTGPLWGVIEGDTPVRFQPNFSAS